MGRVDGTRYVRVHVPNPKQSMCGVGIGDGALHLHEVVGSNVLGTNRFLVLKILFHVSNKSPKDGVFFFNKHNALKMNNFIILLISCVCIFKDRQCYYISREDPEDVAVSFK